MEGVGLFTEDGDRFIVRYRDESNPEECRYRLKVLRVLRNDPSHGIQYKEGDEFNVMVSLVIPGASAYSSWDLEIFHGEFSDQKTV